MASELSNDELKRLARMGTQARLEQIEEERRSILRAFQGLAATIARQKASEAAPEQPAPDTRKKKSRRRRRKMTAAEKRAASERMKNYWAARKRG